tara:strand:+ start:630 stop:809 length:180 start_codon:yes stop_codon:yes gene_type:complete
VPYTIRKSKDKDGKSIYCAYKKGSDGPKACSDDKKNIQLYVAVALKKSGEKGKVKTHGG